VLGGPDAAVHQHNQIGAACDEHRMFAEFSFSLEGLEDALGLIKHGNIMSTNLLTGKAQNSKKNKTTKGIHLK
jgi:hypothetical protein